MNKNIKNIGKGYNSNHIGLTLFAHSICPLPTILANNDKQTKAFRK